MRRNIFVQTCVAVVLVLLVSSCSTSRKSISLEAGWELLGERKVGFVRDKDEIVVSSGSLFTSIRFRVEDRDVRISDLKVEFANGDKLEPQIDDMIGADQNSRVIEISAEGKNITKIEFKYHTIGTNLVKGRANVLIFGKRYSTYGY